MTLTIHLIVSDADAASRWYQTAFGGQETSRVPLPDGRLIHVGVQLDSVELMLADPVSAHAFDPPAATLPCAFYLHTADVDALWERAIAAGATVVRPVADVFWGEREGQLADPFGYRWGLTQKVRDVSDQELTAQAALMFSTA
jgi:PhnB protein